VALVEITVVPVGTPSASISAYVAGCLAVLEGQPVKYQLTAMGTIMEGELSLLLALARRMHEQTFARGVDRVVTTLRIDDRRDRTLSIQGKVAAVEARMKGDTH
jgi:uncharacterized protein (TIGR00106 family)